MLKHLPDFVYLLMQAAEDLAMADNFDVHSEIPSSLEKWNRLREYEYESFRRLIRHVMTHGDDLLKEVDEY